MSTISIKYLDNDDMQVIHGGYRFIITDAPHPSGSKTLITFAGVSMEFKTGAELFNLVSDAADLNILGERIPDRLSDVIINKLMETIRYSPIEW